MIRLRTFVRLFFFFQAEDGIRDSSVTGVQTCALPICFGGSVALELARGGADLKAVVSFHGVLATRTPAVSGAVKASVLVCTGADDPRSEERRVGKECRSRWSPYH